MIIDFFVAAPSLQFILFSDETMIGVFPDGIIDREIDFLRNVHDNSDELVNVQALITNQCFSPKLKSNFRMNC